MKARESDSRNTFLGFRFSNILITTPTPNQIVNITSSSHDYGLEFNINDASQGYGFNLVITPEQVGDDPITLKCTVVIAPYPGTSYTVNTISMSLQYCIYSQEAGGLLLTNMGGVSATNLYGTNDMKEIAKSAVIDPNALKIADKCSMIVDEINVSYNGTSYTRLDLDDINLIEWA